MPRASRTSRMCVNGLQTSLPLKTPVWPTKPDLMTCWTSVKQVEALTAFQSSRPDSLKYTENGMEHLTKFSLRLWQIGVHEQSHVKGRVGSHGLLRIGTNPKRL